jgi:hypothetical protein
VAERLCTCLQSKGTLVQIQPGAPNMLKRDELENELDGLSHTKAVSSTVSWGLRGGRSLKTRNPLVKCAGGREAQCKRLQSVKVVCSNHTRCSIFERTAMKIVIDDAAVWLDDETHLFLENLKASMSTEEVENWLTDWLTGVIVPTLMQDSPSQTVQ